MNTSSSLLRSMVSGGKSVDPRDDTSMRPGYTSYSNTSPFELLMELMSQEPTVLNCLRVVQSTCLAQGIICKIHGQKCSDDFHEFIMQYYLPFCEHAIRCLFTCGFIPWRLRRLESGDVAPEVLPLGTFTWSITQNTSEQRRKLYRAANPQGRAADPRFSGTPASLPKQPDRSNASAAAGPPPERASKQDASDSSTNSKQRSKNPRDENNGDENEPNSAKRPKPTTPAAIYLRQQEVLRRQAPVIDNEDSKLLRYQIHLTENMGIEETDVEIYEYYQPNSILSSRRSAHSSISSPMSHCITEYCVLRQLQEKKAHADNWNSQAKLICSYSLHSDRYNLQEGNPITNDWIQPQNRLGLATDTNLPVEFEQNAYTRDAVTEAIVASKAVPHQPIVYTLPKNTSLENVPRLEVTDDIVVLQQRLAKSVSSVMGVPYEIISGGYSASTSSDRSLQNHRIFTTNMLEICRHLQTLLQQVYVAVYGGQFSDVRFVLHPSPRISVESVEDIALLMEMGLVSTSNAYEIANMLLGVDLKQATGKDADAGLFSKHFMTPSTRKDRLVAEAAVKKASIRPKTASSKK